MLTRRDRLSRSDFPAALKGGRRVSSAHFTAVVSVQSKGSAVVVPKKVARLSVTRHRIKRRVLAVLRTLPRPRSIILFPNAKVATMPYEELGAEIALLLSKATKTP
jgi:ribonuclease P protein component